MVNPGRLITAMVTPFDDSGNLSRERTEKLVKHLIDTGTECILVSGTTGESPTLSDDEKFQLLDWVRKFVPSNYPVMFGSGTNSTKKSIELSINAKEHGANFLLLVVPYYNKPPQAGMVQHFLSIVNEAKLPSVLYNIPGRTGIGMNPDTVAQLAKNEYIIGIKEASGSLDIASEIRKLTPSDFRIFSGDDSLTLPMLSTGADGVVSVASHFIGKQLRQMIDSYFAGDVDKAREIHIELFPIFKGLFFTTNPIPAKEALNIMGLKVGGLRLPLVGTDDSGREKLRALLKDYDLVR